MAKVKNSSHLEHLVDAEEEAKLSDNRGAVIAVKLLAEYMTAHKEGILQIFREFDTSKDGLLQSDEIEKGLIKLNIEITNSQIRALIAFLDKGGNGEVDLGELDECIKQYRKVKKMGHLEDLIADHSNDPLDAVFPNWLIHRQDFQLVFTRFQEGEQNESEQIVKSFRVDKENRTHEDLQRISQWMEKREILPGLGARRFMELARTVSFEEVDKGHKLCYQGEIGDAFYIIFSGSVRVIIDGGVVGELLPGNGFGERSLETDEPRSATCIASEKSQCVVIKSHEYKLMMKMHQQKKFKQVMNFLQVECRMVKAWTYPKIFKLSAVLVRRAFNTGDVIVKQGEESNVMYLLMKGVVEVQKEVTYLTENRWPDVNNEYTVVQHERMVALPLKTLGVGDHFGEEMILGYNDRQYSVVARGQCEVFAVNKGDVRNFFRGNQIANEVKNETKGLYESADYIKEAHEKKTREARLYMEIKREAFGSKYNKRAGHTAKKKVKRKVKGGLEATLRKLNQLSWEKSVTGQEGGEDGGEEGQSVDSMRQSILSGTSALPHNPLVLPVLKSNTSIRRESMQERQSTLRTSMSLPSLGGRQTNLDAIGRLKAQHDAKMKDEKRRTKELEKEEATRRRGGKSLGARGFRNTAQQAGKNNR